MAFPFLPLLEMSVSAALKNDDDSVVSVLCGDIYGCVGYRDGEKTDTMFNVPCDVLPFPDGSMLVCDCLNYCIRRVEPNGLVETFTGSPDDSIVVGSPSCIIPFDGGFLIGDMESGTLRKIENDGTCTILQELSANNVPGGQRVRCPTAILNLEIGLIVADNHGHRLLKIDENGEITNWAGDGTIGRQNGPRTAATFNRPQCLLVLDTGDVLISDSDNHMLRILDSRYENVSTFAGTGESGHRDGYRLFATFVGPDKTVLLPDGNIAMADMTGHKIRLIRSNGMVSTLAGTGSRGLLHGAPLNTAWSYPCGLGYHAARERLFIADSENHCIRQLKYRPQSIFPRLPFGAQSFGLAQLCNKETYFDHSVQAYDRTWHLHKVLLKLRFPIFLEFSKIDIQRLTKNLQPAFEAIIHWIYTDTIVNLSAANLINILRLIDVFGIETLSTGVIDLAGLVNINLEALYRAESAKKDETARREFIQQLTAALKESKPQSVIYDLTLRLVRLDLYLCMWDAPSELYRPNLMESLGSILGQQIAILISQSAEPVAPDPVVSWEYYQYGDIQSLNQRLEQLVIPLIMPDAILDESTDFRIIANDEVFGVSKAILACQWPYFARMLDFGGSEATKSELDLTEFLDAPALAALVFYLYTGTIPANILTVETANRLLEHASLFGFVDDQNTPVSNFETLMTDLRVLALNQEDIPSLIPSYHRADTIGDVETQLMTLSNLANSFSSIVSQPEELVRAQLATLADVDYKRILMMQFGRSKYV